MTLVSAGRVGRAHGFDGSFWVENASHSLEIGTELLLDKRSVRVERRDGTDAKPLIRLAGVTDPRAHRGESLMVDEELGEGEWLAADLEGCRVPGLGVVKRVIDAPSCSVLEIDDGTLVPFISDAIAAVDPQARTIEVKPAFLGLAGDR